MSAPTPRDCCHKGLYVAPVEAPDGTYAHEPMCRGARDGEYLRCAGTCNTLIVRNSNKLDGTFGYCAECDPLGTVSVKVPRIVYDIGKAVFARFTRGGR